MTASAPASIFAASSDDGETRRVRSRRASRHGFAAHASRTSDSISPASRSARAARRSASVSKWFFFPRTPSPVTHRSADAHHRARVIHVAAPRRGDGLHVRLGKRARLHRPETRDAREPRARRTRGLSGVVRLGRVRVVELRGRSPVRQMRVHHARERGLRERRPLRLPRHVWVALQEHVRRARPRAERRGRPERARHCARRRLVKKEKNRAAVSGRSPSRDVLFRQNFSCCSKKHTLFRSASREHFV